MTENKDGLSSIAIGYAWVVRISSFSLEFAALVGFGYFIDRRFGVAPWGLLIGSGIGLFAFASGLIAAVKRLEEDERADVEEKDVKEKRGKSGDDESGAPTFGTGPTTVSNDAAKK